METGGSSLFSQILSVVDRDRFRVFVRETSSERCSKGFSGWDHLVSMLFCQMAPKKKFRFKSKLYSLDSTVIELCASMFDWALSNMIALLRWNLFTQKNLWKWLDQPYENAQSPPENATHQCIFSAMTLKV